jgi:hypothetical protein
VVEQCPRRAAAIEIDDDWSVVLGDHDVCRIQVVVDDAEGMQVLNAAFNAGEVTPRHLACCHTLFRYDKRGLVEVAGIDLAHQILRILFESETGNSTLRGYTAVVYREVWMWVLSDSFASSKFLEDESGQGNTTLKRYKVRCFYITIASVQSNSRTRGEKRTVGLGRDRFDICQVVYANC